MSEPTCYICGVGLANDPLVKKALSMWEKPPPVFCAACRVFRDPRLDAAGWPLRDSPEAA
jgi:hypothetical protein